MLCLDPDELVRCGGATARLAVFAAGAPGTDFGVSSLRTVLGEPGGAWVELSDGALKAARAVNREAVFDQALSEALNAHRVVLVDVAHRMAGLFSKGSVPRALVARVFRTNLRRPLTLLPTSEFELVVVVAGTIVRPEFYGADGAVHPHKFARTLPSVQPWEDRFLMGSTITLDVLKRTVSAFHRAHKRQVPARVGPVLETNSPADIMNAPRLSARGAPDPRPRSVRRR